MTMRCDEILREIAAHGAELASLGVRSLATVGSAARNEAGPESDVDLVVDFEQPATFDRYVEVSFLLEDLLGCHVDLLTCRSLPAFMRASVEKDLRYVPGLSPISG